MPAPRPLSREASLRAPARLAPAAGRSHDPVMPDPTTPRATSHAARAASTTRIVAYDSARADHRAGYRDLNLAWISQHFVVEPRDRHELDDPEAHILAHGGHIFIAERETAGQREVVGACALLREPDGTLELAKVAVHESVRGQGVGRALGEAAIAAARTLG